MKVKKMKTELTLTLKLSCGARGRWYEEEWAVTIPLCVRRIENEEGEDGEDRARLAARLDLRGGRNFKFERRGGPKDCDGVDCDLKCGWLEDTN